MRLAAHVFVLVALLAAITVGITSSAAAPSRGAPHVTAGVPSNGCVVQARGPDLVEKCGQCTIIGFTNAAARDSLAHQLATANPPAWLAVGTYWIGGDDDLDILGAVYCADRYGGTVERFTG